MIKHVFCFITDDFGWLGILAIYPQAFVTSIWKIYHELVSQDYPHSQKEKKNTKIPMGRAAVNSNLQ